MGKKQEDRKWMRLGLMSLYLLGMAYFSYHALSGERGAVALVSLSKQMTDARGELDVVRAERLNLEHRVKLLRPKSIDLDLLDEQARYQLGLAAPDEVVLFIEQ